MSRFFFLPPSPHGSAGRNGGVLPLLSASLFFGVLAGAAAAMLFRSAEAAEPELFFSALPPQTLPRALWLALRFFLLLFLLGTSWLGAVLTPAAAALRGGLLGYRAAALYAAFSYRGLLAAFFVFGLPALLELPCFLTAAGDTFSAARNLAALRFGTSVPAERTGALRHAAIFVLLIPALAAYGFFLAPLLLRRV